MSVIFGNKYLKYKKCFLLLEMASGGTYEPNFPIYVHDVINYSEIPHINADIKIAKIFEEQRIPTSNEVIEADVLFSSLINYMNNKLSVIEGQTNSAIALYIINRTFECKKWLLRNFFKVSKLFYFPTRPHNTVIPPNYPHQKPFTIDTVPERDISETTIELILLQNRLIKFIMDMSKTNDSSNPEILNKNRATHHTLDLDIFNPEDIFEKLVV